ATYQWQLDGSDISTANGGTGASYTPTESDEGHALQVIVTYAGDGAGSESVTKSAGTVADSADLTATLTGLTSNNAVQGTAVNVTSVQDSGRGVSVAGVEAGGAGVRAPYQWQGDGSDIGAAKGGTAGSYTPTESDEGHA